MNEIKEGSRVIFRKDQLDGTKVEFAKRVERREGVVERIFSYQGATSPRFVVRWLKRGNRGKEFIGYHWLSDLRPA